MAFKFVLLTSLAVSGKGSGVDNGGCVYVIDPNPGYLVMFVDGGTGLERAFLGIEIHQLVASSVQQALCVCRYLFSVSACDSETSTLRTPGVYTNVVLGGRCRILCVFITRNDQASATTWYINVYTRVVYKETAHHAAALVVVHAVRGMAVVP